MSFIKVNKVQHLGSSGDGLVIDDKGTVGIATNNIETNTALVGAANSMTGLYIGDGSLLFNNTLNSCLLYTSPSPRDLSTSRMPSSA